MSVAGESITNAHRSVTSTGSQGLVLPASRKTSKIRSLKSKKKSKSGRMSSVDGGGASIGTTVHSTTAKFNTVIPRSRPERESNTSSKLNNGNEPI